MTDAQRQFVHVARAWAKTFIECSDEQVPETAVQLGAAIKDLGVVYGDEVNCLAFFEETDAIK